MRSSSRRVCLRMMLGMLIGGGALTAAAQSSEFDGTYRLVMRELPDGKKLVPPEVMGLGSYASGLRNLNVVWKTPDGKVASLASISLFKIANDEYSETMLFQRIIDPGHPQGGTLDMSGETRTAKLQRDGETVRYQLAFDAPYVVKKGDKSTATLDGVFVDHWEKLK